jgi:hypothetical protein
LPLAKLVSAEITPRRRYGSSASYRLASSQPEILSYAIKTIESLIKHIAAKLAVFALNPIK